MVELGVSAGCSVVVVVEAGSIGLFSTGGVTVVSVDKVVSVLVSIVGSDSGVIEGAGVIVGSVGC